MSKRWVLLNVVCNLAASISALATLTPTLVAFLMAVAPDIGG